MFNLQPIMLKEQALLPVYHAQEKPDLEEQPERAPVDEPPEPPDRRLENVEICFSTFLLLHFLQITLSAAQLDETKVSKIVLQFLQRYS